MIKEIGNNTSNRREDITLGKWFRRSDFCPIEIPERKKGEYLETAILKK